MAEAGRERTCVRACVCAERKVETKGVGERRGKKWSRRRRNHCNVMVT